MHTRKEAYIIDDFTSRTCTVRSPLLKSAKSIVFSLVFFIEYVFFQLINFNYAPIELVQISLLVYLKKSHEGRLCPLISTISI